MFSVAGLLVQLQEDDDRIREHALKKLLTVVDEYWAEVSDQLPLIETLAEDETFPHQELAASLASRCFYHLEEYDDALRLALCAGAYFDVGSTSEYEVTIVGKCIDKYIALRTEEAEVDPKLESIVEGMFEKCYVAGSFEQALGIALEAHRLDKVEDTLVRSGASIDVLLSHCMVVSQTYVSNRAFRTEVFKILVRLFEAQPTCNYVELATCLHYLGEVKKYAQLLESLLSSEDEAKYLTAFQIAFDLNELQDQKFTAKLLEELPKADAADSGDAPDSFLKRLDTIRDILGEGKSTAMYLDFLYRNNKTDPLMLKNVKQSVEQGRKISVLHNAAIVAHSYLQAGTTVDGFLRDNLEWLGRATNWAKFSATASLGVIHKGNVTSSMRLLEPYLPNDLNSGVSKSPYSEGGALYALGLIHACQGGADVGDQNPLDYLMTALEAGKHQEAEIARESLQHGACLGIGLVAMSSGNSELAEKLQEIVYSDNAIPGEGAALALGMILLGGGAQHSAIIEDMLSYSKDTSHEKITRGLSLAIAMIMFGQEEAADTLIEQLCRDKDPLLRYGGMYTIGMAYAGTANNAAIRRLLHVAVSDVNNDVRRVAVTALGFVIINVPERLPELIALLSESYNPHVRYGACMALAIGCSHMENPTDALQLLEHLMEDKVDFVRQGAMIASAMLLMQQNPETNTRAAALRKKLSETAADTKHSPTMTRMGALLATGIMDAGGRNVTIELMSRSGFPKPPAVCGMVLWSQYWYWYPMMHMLSLSFAPTALIGVNAQLDMPVNFEVDCDADLKQFDYPKPMTEKKEKKQVRVETAVLSMTAKAKAREALKKKDPNAMEEDNGDKAQEAKEDEDAPQSNEPQTKLSNPLRVTRNQSSHIKFKTDRDQRYQPVYLHASHKNGIVVLVDTRPSEEEEVVKVEVPPTGDTSGDDEEVEPPQPFEWTAP